MEQSVASNFDLTTMLGIVVPIGSLLIVLVTAIVTHHLRKTQRDDMEATLKMEMVQRGMSAEEIERVLAARIGKESRYGGEPHLQH